MDFKCRPLGLTRNFLEIWQSPDPHRYTDSIACYLLAVAPQEPAHLSLLPIPSFTVQECAWVSAQDRLLLP